MIGRYLRPVVTKVINPIARGLLAVGLTPNGMTILGATVNCLLAIIFFGVYGWLLPGALALGACVFVDLLDGAMARLIGEGTPFGAVLDATTDRIVDGTIFSCLLWWELRAFPNDAWLHIMTLIVIVTSLTISYAKARAEASGIPVTLGLVERTERLIIGLVSAGVAGLGQCINVHWLTYALHVGMVLLALGSVFTVIERLVFVSRQPHARESFSLVKEAVDSEKE